MFSQLSYKATSGGPSAVPPTAVLTDLGRKLKQTLPETTRGRKFMACILPMLPRRDVQYESDLNAIRRDQAELSFVSVLVDGDGMNFNGRFIQGGKDGGYEASRLLKEAVEKHVQEVDHEVPPNTRYNIRVYANVEGLTKAYREAKVLSQEENLARFIQGFNMPNGLCEFVDAGNGKECADAKLRGSFLACPAQCIENTKPTDNYRFDNFQQNIVDVHCRRVIYCASADNSHARILGSHRKSKRISLIKGPPFAREMENLAGHFETASFDNVFMSTKLPPIRRVSFGPASTSITPPRSPTTNCAPEAKIAPPAQSPAAMSGWRTGAKRPISPVHVNAKGQRVDLPLPYSSNVDDLKRLKLCNQHYLLGRCTIDGCRLEHDAELSSRHLTDLRYIARTKPCNYGLDCKREGCIYGHHCPRDNCGGHGYFSCKFPDDRHRVDTNIVTQE